jgi:hypothetical protein
MTLIAHGGHYFASLLYLVPIVAVVGSLGWAAVREKRRGEAEDAEAEKTEQDPPAGST